MKNLGKCTCISEYLSFKYLNYFFSAVLQSPSQRRYYVVVKLKDLAISFTVLCKTFKFTKVNLYLNPVAEFLLFQMFVSQK
jgi:hypothetical protein